MRWTWRLVREALDSDLRDHPEVRRLTPEVEAAVRAGELTPSLAARTLLNAFR